MGKESDGNGKESDGNGKESDGNGFTKSRLMELVGGIPTEPDVKKIREKYPDGDLKVGIKITYREIGDIIGSKYRSNRFRSVTNAWRKAVFNDSGKVIECLAGIGFIVLNDNEKVSLSTNKFRRAVKQARFGAKILNVTEVSNLSEESLSTYNFNVNRLGKLIAASQLKRSVALPDMTNKSDNGK